MTLKRNDTVRLDYHPCPIGKVKVILGNFVAVKWASGMVKSYRTSSVYKVKPQ